MAAYVETWAREVRAQTPQEAANFKRMAERANVSEDEIEAFKRRFFAVEPPPLAEVFGSDDAAKIVVRMTLTDVAEREKKERERGQARN